MRRFWVKSEHTELESTQEVHTLVGENYPTLDSNDFEKRENDEDPEEEEEEFYDPQTMPQLLEESEDESITSLVTPYSQLTKVLLMLGRFFIITIL